MEPITLRLPSDLIEALDAESTERGFSSRAEYIRYLLQHRDGLDDQGRIRSDIDPNTKGSPPGPSVTSSETSHTSEREMQELQSRVATIEERLDELESLAKIVETVSTVEEETPGQGNDATDEEFFGDLVGEEGEGDEGDPGDVIPSGE